MDQSSIDGVEDMSALADLHEAAIMLNLYQRYKKDNIYVSITHIHTHSLSTYTITIRNICPIYTYVKSIIYYTHTHTHTYIYAHM